MLGEDVLVHYVLGHLQLRDLQALRNSGCKQLRGWVDGAPEAVWEAAALNTVAPYHPMLRCGSVRGYLAWQAEGDAAHAAGHSWPPSSTCIVPRQEFGTRLVVMSSDGHFLAAYSKCILELQNLQLGSTAPFQLPEMHKPYSIASFSSHSTAVALLIHSVRSLQIMIIKTASAALHMLQVPDLTYWAHTPEPDLTWAGSGSKLCLTVGPPRNACNGKFWVWNEDLTLIAHFSSVGGQVSWNSSSTGLLVSECGSPPWGPPRSHRWCLLPEQPGVAACLSEPMPELGSKLHWGIWLPGSGEVVLALDSTLACWSVCRETQAWTRLGDALTPRHHILHWKAWAVSLRHVALVTPAGVCIYVLQPGPRLRLVHDIRETSLSAQQSEESRHGVSFSLDGRYLLRSRHFHIRDTGESCRIDVIHVVTGVVTTISRTRLPANFRTALFVAGGICMTTHAIGSSLVQSHLFPFPYTVTERPKFC